MKRRLAAFEFAAELSTKEGLDVVALILLLKSLPKDTKLVATDWLPHRNTYLMVFRSEKFPEIEVGQAIPTFIPTFEVHDLGAIMMVDNGLQQIYQEELK